MQIVGTTAMRVLQESKYNLQKINIGMSHET